jgi:hypothetical protein
MKTRRHQSKPEGKPVRKIAMRHNRNTASVPKPVAIASGCVTGAFVYKDAQSSGERELWRICGSLFDAIRTRLPRTLAGSAHEEIADTLTVCHDQ